MSRKVLIVVDDLNTHWAERLARSDSDRELSLLALGGGPEVYERAHGPLLRSHGVALLEAGEAAALARSRMERAYPQLIYDLARAPLPGGKSLLDHLAIEDANMWWLTETPEKSPFRCSLVNDVYWLELVRAVVARWAFDEVWVSTTCPELARSVASFEPHDGRGLSVASVRRVRRVLPWLRTVGFCLELLARRAVLFLRVLMQYLVVRRMSIQVPPEQTRALLWAPYPSLWSNALGDNPTDRMYGELSAVLDTWKPTGYLSTIHLPWHRLWRARSEIKRVFLAKRVLPLIGFATWGDLFTILWPPYLAKLVRAMHALHRLPKYWHGEFNIAPVVAKELRCALRGSALLLDIVVMRAVKRLCQQRPVDLIIQSGEFQPIEKAVWYGAGATGVKTVAFQHSTASPMFLNYHFGNGEMESYARGGEDSRAMPLPTFFATTGTYAADALRRAGFPAERMTVCGAIRYRRLLDLRESGASAEALREELGLAPSATVITVAGASKRPDNITMVTSLARALRGLDREVTLLIKAHPLLPMEQEMASVLHEERPEVPCLTMPADGPLYGLLAASDVLLTNSSASGVEAIALGVAPVFFHNPYLYDVSVLYSLGEAVLLVSNTEELAAALQTLMGDRGKLEQTKRSGEAIIGELFHGMDTHAEERLLAFLPERDRNAVTPLRPRG